MLAAVARRTRLGISVTKEAVAGHHNGTGRHQHPLGFILRDEFAHARFFDLAQDATLLGGGCVFGAARGFLAHDPEGEAALFGGRARRLPGGDDRHRFVDRGFRNRSNPSS